MKTQYKTYQHLHEEYFEKNLWENIYEKEINLNKEINEYFKDFTVHPSIT
jgi:hypothetical protein